MNTKQQADKSMTEPPLMEKFPEPNTIPSGWNMSEIVMEKLSETVAVNQAVAFDFRVNATDRSTSAFFTD